MPFLDNYSLSIFLYYYFYNYYVPNDRMQFYVAMIIALYKLYLLLRLKGQQLFMAFANYSIFKSLLHLFICSWLSSYDVQSQFFT